MRHATAEPQARTFQFGAFRLDPEAHLLLRDGQPVPLPPKAFDTLLILVREPGSLVAKDKLLQELWPDSYVEENNLNQYISTLRKALGENGHGAKYIETIPRLGYRFVAEVREGGTEPVETAPQEKSWTRLARLAAASVIVGMLAAALTYRFLGSSVKTTTVSASTRTLAVLPLRNLKPDPQTDFLSMALADAIINRLGYASELAVQPFSAVARYRNQDVDPRQIASDLKVQNVLAGSYIREGDDLRITTELISADKSGALRRDSIEMKYENLMSVQDRVAASVIHSMGMELRPDEVDRLKRGLPKNPVAYEYYLRGCDLGFKSDFAGATRLLEKSVELEAGNAMAWMQLANTYLAYAKLQDGGGVYADKGWAAFQKALELDGDNPLIVDDMSFQLIENNKGDQAIPLLRESLRHNPQDSFAHWYLSEAYRYGGALEQSIAEGELALKLNPSVAENLLFNTYLYSGDYKKFLASLPQDENNARTVFYRGLAYYSLGDKQQAVNEFDRAFALNPSLMHSQLGRALTYAVAQRQGEGIELMEKIERSGNEDGEMVYKMAQVYAQLGDRESSLRLLQRSIELNFHPYSYFLHDPLLEPIRTGAEYEGVMNLARQRQEAFLQQFF